MNLASLILAHDNWLPMDIFMEKALFDPEEGYYSKNIGDIGFRGDFSTSATQSRLLARRLVQEWKQSCKEQGKHLPFLEIGGGAGNLMLDISRELGFIGRMRSTYHMVEKSPYLRDLQKMVGGGFVRTHDDISKALKACKGRAFIFSNELPDAFPAKQFVFQEGEWLELGLAVVDGRIIRQAATQDLPPSCVFENWAQEGQVVEAHPSYAEWYKNWQKHWKGGTHITIDYGNTNERLYYRRPAGSMRGYKAHQVLSVEEILSMPGSCDITCEVNFSDLLALSQACPDDHSQLISQHDFLAPLAIKNNAADAHLIAIPGAGDHFQVLINKRFV